MFFVGPTGYLGEGAHLELRRLLLCFNRHLYW